MLFDHSTGYDGDGDEHVGEDKDESVCVKEEGEDGSVRVKDWEEDDSVSVEEEDESACSEEKMGRRRIR